jgi:hypothetical protein
MTTEYEVLGDPLQELEPSKRQIRAQLEAERLRAAVRRSHFHQYLEGESAGGYYSHSHDTGDELGHIHPGRQAFPARADGGYWEESGPSLGSGLPPSVAADVGRVARMLLDQPRTPDHDLMRWQVRLFCGHVVERTAHKNHKTVRSAFTIGAACPECGLDPASIIAARPLGLEAEPPASPRADAPTADVAKVRRQLARAPADVARLEAELPSAIAEDSPSSG